MSSVNPSRWEKAIGAVAFYGVSACIVGVWLGAVAGVAARVFWVVSEG